MPYVEFIQQNGKKESAVMDHECAVQFEQFMETVAPIVLKEGKLLNRDTDRQDLAIDDYTIEEWDENGPTSQEEARLCELCARQLQSEGFVLHKKSPNRDLAPCDGAFYGLNCKLSDSVAA